MTTKPYVLILFSLLCLTLTGVAQQGTGLDEALPQDFDALEEIRDVFQEAEFPLSQEQEQALRPIVDSRRESQRGAVIEGVRRDDDDILTPGQDGVLLRVEAGRILLADGVDGLRALLAQAEAPALTFDQETQVQAVYEAHERALWQLLQEESVGPDAVEAEKRTLEEQLLLASLKFLNPAQRVALVGSVAAEALTSNSDLPEDEDELREYLGDLRSPAGGGGDFGRGGGRGGGRDRGGRSGRGGGGGGGIVIDGFGGGRMPNRDEIQEIRINENAFTAEQSEQSRGRTEIITRGGTGRFNGDVTFDFADESLDARDVFAATRPPYQQRNFETNVSGPIIRNRLTLTFSMNYNTNEDGNTLNAITPDGLINDAITNPRLNRGFTTRATAQLNENNVLNFSYTYGTNDRKNNGVGGFGLPEQGSNSFWNNFNFQVKETSVLSRSFNNEARFRVGGFTNENRPITVAPHITVTDSFRSGGSTRNSENDTRNYEFGDLLMYTGQRLSLKMGFEGEYASDFSISRNNFNGSFTFSRLDCDPKNDDPCAGAFVAGRPIRYSVNQGVPELDVTQFEMAAFVQSDFRLTPSFTMGFGLRYERQTNLNDGNNFDPRLGFAYSLGRSTVIRGGSGIFHQRFNLFQVKELIRLDGTRQRTLTIRNPAYPDPFLSGDGGVVRVPSSVSVRAEDLAAPYTWNNEFSIETTFSQGLVLTGSYRFVRGIHLHKTRNLNAPLDITSSVARSCRPEQLTEPDESGNPATCVRPDPARGNISQLESTGVSNNHNLRVGFRQRFSTININGNYNFSSNYSDVFGGFGGGFGGGGGGRGPADNYDLDSEWGRFGARHRFNSSVNFRLHWNINANTNFQWNTGNPYSLQTGEDDNQDTNTNDRPPGVPRNSLTGPGFFQMGLNLSKTVQLISDSVEAGGAGGRGGAAAGGGYYGRRTGVRMTITARAENLLNNVNFQSFSGVMTSPFFGRAIRARDARQIRLSVRFNF